MTFHLGDLGEAIAFTLLAVFVAIEFAPVWALLVAAIAIFYMAQGWTKLSVARPHLPALRRRADQ